MSATESTGRRNLGLIACFFELETVSSRGLRRGCIFLKVVPEYSSSRLSAADVGG